MIAPAWSRILIVEDDPALVELLRFSLETVGYEIYIVVDGDECIAAVKDEQPDLVVLDCCLMSRASSCVASCGTCQHSGVSPSLC